MRDLSWNTAAFQFGSIQFYLAQKQRKRVQDYNKCGEEAQKETIRLINIGLPQSIIV